MDLKVKIMLNWAGPLGCMDMAVSPLHSHASVTLLHVSRNLIQPGQCMMRLSCESLPRRMFLLGATPHPLSPRTHIFFNKR